MKEFCAWLSTTAPSVFIQEHNYWAIPGIQSVHIAGVAVVMGALFLMVLRILGLTWTDQTLRQTVDRFGQLPVEVETLFAVALLRITCTRLGVGEVSTYRQQVRLKPLELPEALELDLSERVPGARYLRTTATLNLDIGRVPGAELPGLVERGMVRAMGEDEVVATMPS